MRPRKAAHEPEEDIIYEMGLAESVLATVVATRSKAEPARVERPRLKTMERDPRGAPQICRC